MRLRGDLGILGSWDLGSRLLGIWGHAAEAGRGPDGSRLQT